MYNQKVTRMESKIILPIYKVPVGIYFYHGDVAYALTGDISDKNGKPYFKALSKDRQEIILPNDSDVIVIVADMTACQAFRQNYRYFVMGSKVFEFTGLTSHSNGYHITNIETGESDRVSIETLVRALD